MRMWKWLVVAGLLVSTAGGGWAQPVDLKLKFPEGRKARYKSKFRIEYFSNLAEQIVMQSGKMRVIVDNEWRSHEEVVKPEALPKEEIPEGVMGIRAEIKKGASSAIFLGEKQTYEQYPFTFDMFNDKSFTWRVTPGGKVEKFEPDFPAFRVERQDLITDLFQGTVPAYCPALPDKPVSEGDTWTGEREFWRPFASMDMMGRDSQIKLKSTYRVKSIKKKKGNMEVTIEEDREVEYKGWMDVSSASLYYHGKGTGGGSWVIDATRGLVLQHKVHMEINKPTIIKAGHKEPIANIVAEVKVDLERKLEKLEKE
ncbi:MAG: hypothetical protein QGG64_04390 [Candidatus Latescibacteria bacterium]|nr:hypothetical protein [Candidatus Latescibacterota bacterium]